MELDQLSLVAPLLSVTLFFFIEKALLKRKGSGSKLALIAVMQGINLALLIALSMLALTPLVFLLAPFQIFSFSEWQVPVWVSFTASILALDLLHYASHRLHHKIPMLWRFHRLHHSDRQVDASTTLLHHPLEIVTGFLVLIVFAVLFDVPLIALVIYSIMAGIHSGFTHLDYEFPPTVERILKWFMITPNFHRRHHSLSMDEGNSNFGAVFIFWDYLFGTVTSGAPFREAIAFGIDECQSPRAGSLTAYLANPLK